MNRLVLIVIEMLNDFLKSWDAAPRDELVGAINDLVSLFRRTGNSVV